METDRRGEDLRTPRKADHLCVLIHGLWGTPAHLAYIESALTERYSSDRLIVLATKSNAGNFTYDGIDCGAERVAKEIEEQLDGLGRDGYKIEKLSIVGYSLGGLVARYVIGLLYSKGLFKTIRPVNFTTFATPHLGVRTPLQGYWSRTWNFVGGRLLSASGRQLFTIDAFRDDGRPILSVLADPKTIFIKALSMFESRLLYSNIVNDRSAPHYTTAIVENDPFTEMDDVEVSFLSGYDPVLLDPENPVRPKDSNDSSSVYSRLLVSSRTLVSRLPLYFALLIFIPIGVTFFFINSGVQSRRSKRRIQHHEDDASGSFRGYQVPLMVQQAVEDAFENINAAQGQQYLPNVPAVVAKGSVTTKEFSSKDPPKSAWQHATKQALMSKESLNESSVSSNTENPFHGRFPTLALTAAQFGMIKALNDVGFKKYYVWIHRSNHSHAAIIVRTKKDSFAEGKVVIEHWLREGFQV